MTIKSRIHRLEKLIAPAVPCRCHDQEPCDVSRLTADERLEAIRLIGKVKQGQTITDSCPDCGGDRTCWNMKHMTDEELERLIELTELMGRGRLQTSR